MKKVLLAALFAISASAAFSQANINKGNWMIGGDINFSSSKYENADNSVKDFSFSPNVGYFFINKLAGGLRVKVNTNNYTSGNTGYESSEVLVAPFLRYYFLPSSQKVNVFADAAYGFGNSKSGISNVSTTRSLNAYALKAGAAIFVVPSVAVEISLGYNSSKMEDVNERYNTIMTGIGLQIHLPGSARK